MRKPVIAFTAVVSIGILLDISGVSAPLPPFLYWALVLGAALLAAFTAGSAPGIFSAARGEFLCDSCKYNDARYCSRPERPNARSCPDWKAHR
jgi:hypothetical protein